MSDEEWDGVQRCDSCAIELFKVDKNFVVLENHCVDRYKVGMQLNPHEDYIIGTCDECFNILNDYIEIGIDHMREIAPQCTFKFTRI